MKKNNNLIAISGKIGSGKDTVGKIIQYLVGENKYDKEEWYESLEDFCKDTPGENSFDSGFKIKKFADKLKDMVCLLLSCTRQQLEDQEFKEKELGEEWTFYRMIRKSFPSFLVATEHEALTLYASRIPHRYVEETLTPRELLQLLGTESTRHIIHPNIWINSLMSDYKAISGYKSSDMTLGATFYGEDGKVTERVVGNKVPGTAKDTRIFPKWIITDLRFPNELKAIEDRKGITIRVDRRLNCEVCKQTKTERRGKPCTEITCPDGRSQHESETALDNAKFDYVINNDSTIESLIEEVKQILIKEKIL